MMMNYVRIITGTVFFALMAGGMTGCKENTPAVAPSGAVSGLVSVDIVREQATAARGTRPAALLGLYTAEHLAQRGAQTTEGAILGVVAQQTLAENMTSVDDADFQLLQAFADALQVDVADMLNRSQDRAGALDTYTQALSNITQRANSRTEVLSSVIDELDDVATGFRRESNAAKRSADSAIAARDFAAAAEAQKLYLEKESAYVDASMRLSQATEIHRTLDELLSHSEEKMLAIERNREALIVGVQVVDVPGIDDLKLIERVEKQKRRPSMGGLL